MDLAFLRADVSLEQVSRHAVVSTNASIMGWWVVCNEIAAADSWIRSWIMVALAHHCLELLAVFLTL